MWTKVILEPWRCDSSQVHVYFATEYGNSPPIHSLSGDICSRYDDAALEVSTVKQIGGIAGKYKTISGADHIDGNCRDFCAMVNSVLEVSPKEIAEARGMIEDIDCDTSGLCDLEIAFLDWKARELWAEIAREVDDPWNTLQKIEYEMEGLLSDYLADRREDAVA